MMWSQVCVSDDHHYDASTLSIDATLQSTPSSSLIWSKFASFLQGKGSQQETETLPSAPPTIAIHSSQTILAVGQANHVSIYTVDFSSVPPKFHLVVELSQQRFESKIRSILWTEEAQKSFLVGTSSGLCYCTMPEVSCGQAIEGSSVEVRNLALPRDGLFIDMLAASPQGRLFACGSYGHADELFVCDAWLGTVCPVAVGKAVEQLHWLKDWPCLVATAKNGELLVLDTYRWGVDSYSLKQEQVFLRPVGKGLLACVPSACEVAYLELVGTANQQSVLIRQAPSMKAHLDYDDIDTKVHLWASSEDGEVVAVVYQKGEEVENKVVTYVSSYKDGAGMTVTALQTLSRRGCGQTVRPLALTMGSLRDRAKTSQQSSRPIVYIFWSDGILTCHLL